TRKDLWRFDGEDEEQLPGICWVCKWIVNKVKKTLPRDNSEKQDEVKNKLLRVCDKIGFVKSVCKKFVSRSIDVLVEELSTNDDAKTTCVNLKACSHKSTVEDIVLEVMESMQRKNIL
ncbi:non-pathogenic pore-forming peptide-like, partial [Arapaima gigas]